MGTCGYTSRLLGYVMENIGNARKKHMKYLVIPSSYYYITPPQILKTRVHLQFWKICGWLI